MAKVAGIDCVKLLMQMVWLSFHYVALKVLIVCSSPRRMAIDRPSLPAIRTEPVRVRRGESMLSLIARPTDQKRHCNGSLSQDDSQTAPIRIQRTRVLSIRSTIREAQNSPKVKLRSTPLAVHGDRLSLENNSR